MDIGNQLARGHEASNKLAIVFQKRLRIAQEHYSEALKAAYAEEVGPALGNGAAARNLLTDWQEYLADSAQRTILFWDALRQRGNAFIERSAQGLPPVLHFDYETVVDGRTLARPVNYALVRIVPPEGVVVDATRRPYVIVDPRAGHGPGIGGMKDDSQVGVALRAGHPVYFVIFFRDPEPGQTLLDVCEAERGFVKKVRELHPASPKPAIVGNCQGGWASMMLAASSPEDTGPIVINGAPMSYWGGAWQEGEGDNPMRYAGGLLGGTWLASFASDLGNGVFDGAHLVQNFENLNLANTFWDKYYHLYANADTEPPRFLDFERWWGGFYLMNREEIEWITRNLFVGNKLWTGETKGKSGQAFDLRDIRSPIILFASMGDNITPPQQAYNWVADVYGSTDEIKARGQVIVGLLHEDVGHLGIFVSGKVARREYTQIVSVLQSIEGLRPGLYAMAIHERKDADGKVSYDVDFTERRLEEITARLNRFERADEKPFEAVNVLSEFNQRAYELFAQPFVQATSNEYTAKLGREFHPLRFQRWAFSDVNPWLAWLKPAADAVRAQRKAASEDNVVLKTERAASKAISASLEYGRAVRDAASEAMFFQTYANVFSLYLAGKGAGAHPKAEPVAEARELPYVAEALASMDEGSYPEALARVAAMLAKTGEPLPLATLSLKQELKDEYADLLPPTPPDEWRRTRGEQEIVVRYEPEQALATLPKLLADPADRQRLVTLVRKLLADERIRRQKPSAEQLMTLERVGDALQVPMPNASRVRELLERPAPASEATGVRKGTAAASRRNPAAAKTAGGQPATKRKG
jgi:pimeloyl-ACP methyl ester carboxylesterase